MSWWEATLRTGTSHCLATNDEDERLLSSLFSPSFLFYYYFFIHFNKHGMGQGTFRIYTVIITTTTIIYALFGRYHGCCLFDGNGCCYPRAVMFNYTQKEKKKKKPKKQYLCIQT